MAIDAAESLQMELPLESKEERLLRNVSIDFEIQEIMNEIKGHMGSIKSLKGQLSVKEQEKAQLLVKLSPGNETIVIAQEDNSEPDQSDDMPSDDELSEYDDDPVDDGGELAEQTDDTPAADLDPEFVEEAREHLEKLVSGDEPEADADGEAA